MSFPVCQCWETRRTIPSPIYMLWSTTDSGVLVLLSIEKNQREKSIIGLDLGVHTWKCSNHPPSVPGQPAFSPACPPPKASPSPSHCHEYVRNWDSVSEPRWKWKISEQFVIYGLLNGAPCKRRLRVHVSMLPSRSVASLGGLYTNWSFYTVIFALSAPLYPYEL